MEAAGGHEWRMQHRTNSSDVAREVLNEVVREKGRDRISSPRKKPNHDQVGRCRGQQYRGSGKRIPAIKCDANHRHRAAAAVGCPRTAKSQTAAKESFRGGRDSEQAEHLRVLQEADHQDGAPSGPAAAWETSSCRVLDQTTKRSWQAKLTEAARARRLSWSGFGSHCVSH